MSLTETGRLSHMAEDNVHPELTHSKARMVGVKGEDTPWGLKKQASTLRKDLENEQHSIGLTEGILIKLLEAENPEAAIFLKAILWERLKQIGTAISVVPAPESGANRNQLSTGLREARQGLVKTLRPAEDMESSVKIKPEIIFQQNRFSAILELVLRIRQSETQSDTGQRREMVEELFITVSHDLAIAGVRSDVIVQNPEWFSEPTNVGVVQQPMPIAEKQELAGWSLANGVYQAPVFGEDGSRTVNHKQRRRPDTPVTIQDPSSGTVGDLVQAQLARFKGVFVDSQLDGQTLVERDPTIEELLS